MPNTSGFSWQVVATFSDRASAHVLAERLRGEGVPAELTGALPLLGEIQHYQILVPIELAHRARWIISQAQFTDEELTFFALGKLEGADGTCK